ncbi:MAG: arginase [Methylobacter sp.]|uniref:arginase n=1 Tax=Methylobacter sp. TaxID=2051955 RepID=UPI0025F9576E|nr:arginase [Methylobacter sp.]MCK9623041.1 arginase [Methylobacter sp.]
MATIQTLGVASCLGGPMRLCGYAAEMLHDEFDRQRPGQQRLQLQWHMVHPEDHGTKEEKLSRLNQSISRFTQNWTEQKQTFLVIGGDHSCALGTWGGVINGLQQPDKLGLIWLDAHMDAHTFATSHSGNIHGMPVAALLGKADKKLAAMYPGQGFIKPENFIMIGIRSYEVEEYQLLKQAAVEIVFADRINGLSQALIKAIDKLSRSCEVIGISLDLDFIDPDDAPGVETPAQGGIKAEELLAALSVINRHPLICGLEISEFNPENDFENKTVRLMKEIVETFYGENS